MRTPTVPLGGVRRAARWNVATDDFVAAPNTPSTVVGTRTRLSQLCKVRTSPPRTPGRSTRENGDPAAPLKLALLAQAVASAATLLYLDECDLHLLPVIRACWMKGLSVAARE